jgi:NADPH:quinone reductase-like Zn-dependent oxidoreductase
VKAAVHTRYGPPEVVRIEDVEEPAPKEGEVLIAVRAASVNPLDWHFMRGTPYFLRLAAGLRKPNDTRLGVDVAGRVEAVGGNVTRFQAGDEVFGSCRGAFAEYACAREKALAMKPGNATFEQAAAAPIAGFTALQGLRDKGRIQPGRKVLINGAAGGVGTLAVEIAKEFGAEVTGVCSTRNVEMVRSLGADRAIDYTREDFTAGGERYDIFLDCVGNRSFRSRRRVLDSQGIYVGVGGSGDPWMIGFLAGAMVSMVLSGFTSRKMVTLLARPNQEDLTWISRAMTAGKVMPVIDRSYPLRGVPEAIRYVEAGHARGKVVIAI